MMKVPSFYHTKMARKQKECSGRLPRHLDLNTPMQHDMPMLHTKSSLSQVVNALSSFIVWFNGVLDLNLQRPPVQTQKAD